MPFLISLQKVCAFAGKVYLLAGAESDRGVGHAKEMQQGDVLQNRTHEESSQNTALSPATCSELVQSEKGLLKWHCRGLKQQSKSHYQKFLWFSHLSWPRIGRINALLKANRSF
jgi:hypothetical protein